MSRILAVLALLLPGLDARAAECDQPAVSDVQAILAATTVGALDSAMASTKAHAATQSLYRARRLELSATPDEERRYFRALPRSESELRCVYTLTHPSTVNNRPEISQTVHDMFGRAARIARKLGIGHERVAHLALWSDGELAEQAWDAFHWLLLNDPELTAAAIRKLPRKDQMRMCGGDVVTSLSVTEVVKRCRRD